MSVNICDAPTSFISYEKIKESATEGLEDEIFIGWGKEVRGGEEEWKVDIKSIPSNNMTRLSYSDFRFSNSQRISHNAGRFICDGDDYTWESCIINEKLKNVCYF